MTGTILPNDNNDRIDRLENLIERLINVNLATQSQIGFLAGTMQDLRQNVAHLESGQAETNQKLAETDRKIDIILHHITGMSNDSNP
jgi:phage shock protein A